MQNIKHHCIIPPYFSCFPFSQTSHFCSPLFHSFPIPYSPGFPAPVLPHQQGLTITTATLWFQEHSMIGEEIPWDLPCHYKLLLPPYPFHPLFHIYQLSCTGHQISLIKSAFEYFCVIVWSLAHFFENSMVSWAFLHVLSHWQRLFRHYNDECEFWWYVIHVRLHIMSSAIRGGESLIDIRRGGGGKARDRVSRF